MRTVISSMLALGLSAGCTAWDGFAGNGNSFAWIDAENSPVLEGQAQASGADPSVDTPPFTSPAGLPTGQVFINEHAFQVEIASTNESRVNGLMWRKSLAPDAGMLFVFEQPEYLSFWMRNTLIPLDIAFIRADGTIESMDTMQPRTLASHRSGEPVPLALEVPAGTFERLDITLNDRVTILGLQ